MDVWEKIISFESLYKAHRRARLGKRGKKEVIQFEMNLAENLYSLHYDLKYGRYKVGGYHTFMIYDPKEREIQAIGYRDRVVQHSICDNFLVPLLERHLIYDNVACRKKKGSGLAVKRLRMFMTKHYKAYGNKGYFVKADVKKFFNSIPHEPLKQALKTLICDERILALLFALIDSYQFTEGRGLPMGNQTSQCFAVFYLNTLDRGVKERLRVRHYVRYMDDMILLLPSKKQARGCLRFIESQLIDNRLQINEKSQIAAVKNGVVFLAWKFFYSQDGAIVQKVKRQTKRRIFEKMRIMDGFDKQSLVSYAGLLGAGNGFLFLQRMKIGNVS